MNEPFIERKLGNIVRGFNIGAKVSNSSHKYIWHACTVCGKERWVPLLKGEPEKKLCWSCAMANRRGEKHHNWKGGKRAHEGYIQIKLSPDDFFYDMASSEGYILEHRFVMARHLGRCLQPWEIVHHKDGDRGNNRIENLELLTRNDHISDHSKGYRDGYRKGLGDGRLNQIQELKRRIAKLEIDNKLLKWQISQFRGESCQIKISR